MSKQENELMTTIEKMKESKKNLNFRKEAAEKMVSEACDEFLDLIHSLAKNVSVEELKEIINIDDDLIDEIDILAFISAYADTHDEFGGVVVIIGNKDNVEMEMN